MSFEGIYTSLGFRIRLLGSIDSHHLVCWGRMLKNYVFYVGFANIEILLN